jgi:hypothetical protein
MILKTPHGMGPLQGFGIARRIEQLSDEVLQLNEGTVYTSLLAAAIARLHPLGVGHFREQPQSEGLLHHWARAETTGP